MTVMGKMLSSSLSVAVALGVGMAAGCRTPETMPPPAAPKNHGRALLEGESIRHFPPSITPNGHLVILVHGLFRGSSDLVGLGRRLADAGYEVYVYDYRSTRKDVSAHAADFRRFLIAAATEYPDHVIDIVTHSMGALLIRAALAHLDSEADPAWCDAEAARILTADRFGRVVMIAPPNRGSDVAKRVLEVFPGGARLVKPLPDLSSQDGALAARLPRIYAIPTGIVVARFDVAVRREYVDYGPATAVKIINIDHSLAPYDPRVRRAVERFLRSGSFE